MNFLKQSTAVAVALGPFLDSTDGVTAETGLTISQADVRLKKNNGNWAQANDSTAATHEENGWYEKDLDATDTDTVGILIVAVNESGALPVWREFQVVEEAVYDAMFGASALGYVANAPVNVAQISGDGTAADNLETLLDDTPGSVPWSGIIDQGTAQSATGTTLVLRSAAAFANDEIIGATILITGGSTGVGQSRTITDYVAASDTATVETWTTTPTGTITYKIFATAASSASGGGDATEAKQDAIIATLGSAGAGLTAIPWNAAWDAEVQSECTDALNVYDPPTNTEMEARTLAAASYATATGVSAVENDTQDIQSRLPAALNNGCIPADVQRFNDVEVVGAGTSGNKWRA